VGQSVRLHGLVGNPALNGKQGIIVKFDRNAPDRAHVSLHSGDPKEVEEIKSIAKSKMEILEPPVPPGSFDDLARFLENFEYESRLASFVATKCCEYRGVSTTTPVGSEEWMQVNEAMLERAEKEYLRRGKGKGPWKCRLCDERVPLESLREHLASVKHGRRLTNGPEAPSGFKRTTLALRCDHCMLTNAFFKRCRVKVCWKCLLEHEHDLMTLKLDTDKLEDLGVSPCSRAGELISSSFNCRICMSQLKNGEEVLNHCEGSHHSQRWMEEYGTSGAYLKLFQSSHWYQREGE